MKKTKHAGIARSVAVLLPCEHKEAEGMAFIYEDGWAKARHVRVMRAYEESRSNKAERENPGWCDFIHGVKKLMAAEKNPTDSVLIGDARELMAPYLRLSSKGSTRDFKDAWFLVAGVVAFEGVHLTLWQTKPDKKGNKQVLLGLYCPDDKAAIAADTLLRDDFRICTHCNKPFLAQRDKQTAHSVKCREAHRAARYYAKHKHELALKRKRKKEAA